MRKTYEQMIECNCDMANTLAIVSGKWKLLILYHLLNKEHRFNELHRLLNRITAHTLSKELKELIGDGLIEKTTYNIIPPKTIYNISDKGKELEIVLVEMKKFGHRHPLKISDDVYNSRNVPEDDQ
ncbi:winged helix-turn-helix transcriptional regulator [Enterococcus sp. AZ072]|uniref:winged helix-turn-helix transcriptional regulator n=1 Tax=unclassified Enterococcus TaxID=2608891 RepID=UPI003D271601